MGDLATKIDKLITEIGGLSHDRIAQEIKAAGGPTISGAYLWQLRTGARDNPTLHHLQALSKYFSDKLDLVVALDYFSPDAPVERPWEAAERNRQVEELEGEHELTVRLEDRGIRHIASRYGSVSPTVQRQILAIVDTLSAPEIGPDDDGPTPG